MADLNKLLNEADIAAQPFQNPFSVTLPGNTSPAMRKKLMAQWEKNIKNHIEFELLCPPLSQYLKNTSPETIQQISKILCEEITLSEHLAHEERLFEVLTQFSDRTNDIWDMDEKAFDAIKAILEKESTLFSMDTAKLERITNCIKKLKDSTIDEDVTAKIDKVYQKITGSHWLSTKAANVNKPH